MAYSRFTKIDAILDKADDYFEVKRYEESLPYIDEAIKEIILYKAETWFYKGRALRFTRHLEEAFECFNKAYELAPDNKEYLGMREIFFVEELSKDMQRSLIAIKDNTDKLLQERWAIQIQEEETKKEKAYSLMKTFTSVTEFADFIKKQNDNTGDNPYIIKINISDEKDFETIKTEIFKDANKRKYVYLDLSDSTIKEIPNQPSKYIGNKTLVGIILPNSVTSIGDNAFFSCLNLTDVIIPDSITNIGDNTFGCCSSLDNITMPNNITRIGNNTFSYCSKLKNIIIPNSVTSIGDRAFVNCNKFYEIDIPSSVTSIGYYAFGECINLYKVTFQGTIPSSGFSANEPFGGNLRDVFYAINKTKGTPGIYKTSTPVNGYSKWRKYDA